VRGHRDQREVPLASVFRDRGRGLVVAHQDFRLYGNATVTDWSRNRIQKVVRFRLSPRDCLLVRLVEVRLERLPNIVESASRGARIATHRCDRRPDKRGVTPRRSRPPDHRHKLSPRARRRHQLNHWKDRE
jgi:hypothetical protein